jgi:hypothetical protein
MQNFTEFRGRIFVSRIDPKLCQKSLRNFTGIDFYVMFTPLQVYQGELNLEDGETFHDRPPLEIVIRYR